MSNQEHEELRATVWDNIYQNGPQSIDQLATEMQLSIPTVIGLVDHSWFSINDQVVEIASSTP